MNDKVAAWLDILAKSTTKLAKDEKASLEDTIGYLTLAIKEEWRN